METLNRLKQVGLAIVNNIVAILFLLGLIIISTAVFIGFGLVVGLIATGIMIIIVSTILAIEQGKQPPQ